MHTKKIIDKLTRTEQEAYALGQREGEFYAALSLIVGIVIGIGIAWRLH